MKQDCLQGNLITLSKLGKIKVILHRPIPNGFKIKTASVTNGTLAKIRDKSNATVYRTHLRSMRYDSITRPDRQPLQHQPNKAHINLSFPMIESSFKVFN